MPPPFLGPSSANHTRGREGVGERGRRARERESLFVRENKSESETSHFSYLANAGRAQRSSKTLSSEDFHSRHRTHSPMANNAEAAKAMKMAEQEMEYRVELFNK